MPISIWICGKCRFFDRINQLLGRCALKKSPNGGYPRNVNSELCKDFKNRQEIRDDRAN